MRAPNNIMKPGTYFWAAAYVLALLSLYTFITRFLAYRQEQPGPPQNQSEASTDSNPKPLAT